MTEDIKITAMLPEPMRQTSENVIATKTNGSAGLQMSDVAETNVGLVESMILVTLEVVGAVATRSLIAIATQILTVATGIGSRITKMLGKEAIAKETTLITNIVEAVAILLHPTETIHEDIKALLQCRTR